MSAGKIQPKSMSTEEAAAYLADPSNFGPENPAEQENGTEQLALQLDALRHTLQPAGVPMQDGLRNDEQITADIELAVGELAGVIKPRYRNAAIERLINDLIDARDTISSFT